MQRLEEILRSSKLVAGGFLGTDTRPLEEIIDADARALEETGYDREQLAARLRRITDLACEGIETVVRVGDKLDTRAIEARGQLPCPWDHAGRYFKNVVEVRRTDTGRFVRWSDLSVHMIEAHGFFQGRGSSFRLEPKELVDVVFAF